MSSPILSNIDHIHLTLDTLIQIGDFESVSHIIKTVGSTWETHEYLDKGLYYTSTLLESKYSHQIPYKTRIQLHQLAGNFARHQSNYPLANSLYLDGLNIKNPATFVSTNLYKGLGETAFRQGNYLLAHEYYEQYYTVNLDCQNLQGVADALTALGRIHMARGHFKESSELFQQSSNIIQDNNYLSGKGWLLNALGEFDRANHNIAKAIDHYQQSISIFKKLENHGVMMLVKQNLAFALLAANRFTEAEKLLRDTLKFWYKGIAIHGLVLSLLGWSIIMAHRQRYCDAAQIFAYINEQLKRVGATLELGDLMQYERMQTTLQAKLSKTQQDHINEQSKSKTLEAIMTLVDPSSFATRHHNSHLTKRENEVFQYMAQGLSDKEIAERCTISKHTVNTHLRNIFRKVGVNTRAEAVHKAHKLDLL